MAAQGLARILQQLIMIILSFLIGVLFFQPSLAVCGEADSLQALLNSVAGDEEEKKAIILGQIAFHHQLDNPDSAYYFAREGLDLAERTESGKAMVKNLVQLGYYYYLLDSLDLAKAYYQRASSYFNEDSDLYDMVRTWNTLAAISEEQSDYFRSMEYYLRAKSIAERMNDSYLIAMIANNMGILSEKLNEPEDAYAQYAKAAGLFEAIGDSIQLGYTLNNMAVVQRNKHHYDSAVLLFQRAGQLFTANKDQYGLANLYLNLAVNNIARGSTEEARKHIELGMESSQQLGTYQQSSLYEQSYYLLGQVMMLENKPRRAIGYLKLSYDKAMENDHLDHLADLTKLLAKAYELSGRPDSSIFYYKEFITYSDSLAKINNDREIDRIRYEADLLREKEHFMAQTQMLKERNAYRNRIILLISILIFVMLLSVILYLNFRMKRNALVRENMMLNNKHLSEKLEFRKKEIAAQLLFLEQKNNLICNIAKNLKDIVPHTAPENKIKIQDSIRKLEKAHYSTNWSEFELLFKDIHSDFYFRLNRKFPNLTPNDQKMCAFILLNMSTKDIAAITFQNYESIRTARHRLRKKLNIESDQHLQSFLAQI